MRDLRNNSKNELSLNVFNDEYFYIERGNIRYLIALVNEEFLFTDEQMEVLMEDLKQDALEIILNEDINLN